MTDDDRPTHPLLPRRRPGAALRAVEESLGRRLAGPARPRFPRPDWADAYRRFDTAYGLTVPPPPLSTLHTQALWRLTARPDPVSRQPGAPPARSSSPAPGRR